ncbi:MAG: acetylglutamate kinase [Chitinispirillales bacterium]|jgi:acetylglutamate kinase|nr:acetylglutamate kinase [Chitinispirillales bacterium]
MSLVIIKIGGSTIDTPGLIQEFAQSVGDICYDYRPAIVHGGGKDIARQLDSLKKEYSFVEGMRVTDAETIKVVQMVLSGDVNKRIVNELLLERVPAVGISGVDGGLLTVSKMLVNGQDIGFVGEIKNINTDVLTALFEYSFIPVISPVSRGKDGEFYNVNADLAASKLAMVYEAEDLIFISDVPGVMIDGAVRKTIRVSEIEGLIASGDITGGMIPKLRSAAEAVQKGVGRVHICGWNGSDTLLNELTEENSTGTVIQE